MSAQHADIRSLPPDEIAARTDALRELLQQALTGTVTALAIPDLDPEITMTIGNAHRLPNHLTFAAENNDRLRGVLFGHIRGQVGFIRWVAVNPDSRRQGIASALVDRFEAHTDVKRVEGIVHLDDPEALGFWTKQGWQAQEPPRMRMLMGSQVTRRAGEP